MLSWFARDVQFAGSAFFRGTFPLRAENFEHLKGLGVEITAAEPSENAMWSLQLRHPEWGQAMLACIREMPMPPHILIEWDSQLIPGEVEEIKACGTSVQLMYEGKQRNVLRDRKNALLYLHAILGEEGVAALDHVAQRFWHRDALALEAAHPAELDVEGIMTFHAVSDEEGSPTWLHSHGLGEIGFLDFDIVRPSETLLEEGQDLLRCVAFGLLEGSLKPGGSFEPIGGKPKIMAVTAGEFMEKAAPDDAGLRDDPDGSHLEKRVVLCDPKAGGLRSLFSSRPKPSSVLSEPFPESGLIHFSKESTELMAARAKATLGFFSGIAEELKEFEGRALIKLGYAVDGSEEDGSEHLWFDYHGMVDGQIDATLINEPFRIERLKAGQRGVHDPALLTDWSIFTPIGNITPRSSRGLRFIRQNKDAIRQAMKAAGEQSE